MHLPWIIYWSLLSAVCVIVGFFTTISARTRTRLIVKLLLLGMFISTAFQLLLR